MIYNNNIVHGDMTLLVENTGRVPVKTLVNKTVVVWNGFEYAPVTVEKAAEDRSLVKVTLKNGSFIICHPFQVLLIYKPEKGDETKWRTRFFYGQVRAFELQTSDILCVFHTGSEGKLMSNGAWGKNRECEYVEKVENMPELYDTFRVIEPTRNRVVINGILIESGLKTTL